MKRKAIITRRHVGGRDRPKGQDSARPGNIWSPGVTSNSRFQAAAENRLEKIRNHNRKTLDASVIQMWDVQL